MLKKTPEILNQWQKKILDKKHTDPNEIAGAAKAAS